MQNAECRMQNAEIEKAPPYFGIATVTEIREETPDVKTFRVVLKEEGKKVIDYTPGQCAMLSVPGVGEAMFSITSCRAGNDEYMEFSIKKCGCFTGFLHSIEAGQDLTLRGPYGNGFPVDSTFKGKDLLVIAGGIALAPVRPVVNYCRHFREHYGSIDVVYGARSKQDLVFYKELTEEWGKEKGMNVHLTIDAPQDEWEGHVGFVPNFVKELGFDTSKTVVMCGPPIMIKFTLAGLREMGFPKEQIFTTLEMRMSCGVGKCGRCNIGPKYICKDGPVFSFDQLDELPDEY